MIGAWLSRYGRRRRLIAAAFAAVSVVTAYLATRPAPAGPTVLVAVRDLRPGPLSAADFRPAALDPPPAGAVRTLAPGQALATPHAPRRAADRRPPPVHLPVAARPGGDPGAHRRPRHGLPPDPPARPSPSWPPTTRRRRPARSPQTPR
ncbi:hypothetical protein [Nonomuraea salmonea]|uniref:hypothetical protein n=1 Tax=Nonomuraea salmonea TaxID=46181 RepID=UPI0031EE9B19